MTRAGQPEHNQIVLASVHEKHSVHVNVNKVNIVNIQRHSPSAIEKALGERMRRLLESIPWLQDIRLSDNPAPFQRAFDWLARFKVPNGPAVELWIDCRADPRPVHFPYVPIEREFDEVTTKRIRVRVFGAPYLSPRMRELCEKHGWGWYDLAGNCRITIPGVIHLERTGNSPVQKRPRAVANLSTPEAGRVIRALLAPENAALSWTQRAMQRETDPHVSLGLVNKVIQHLRDEAFLEERSDGGFRLREPVKLLDTWRDAYRFDRHERRGYFTLLKGKELREAFARLGSRGGVLARLAVFSAADIQAPHVRQAKTWLYVAAKNMELFEKLVEAKPVDSGENLVVLIPEDPGVFQLPNGVGMSCTNPAQTYVDLWHCGGRGQEAAEAILEQRLKPAWKDGGMLT